jgi:predicted transcriptional regulator
MTDSTLRITFKKADEHREAARQQLERAERGAADDAVEQDARFILNLETYDDLERLMCRANVELLRVIANEQPESIRETARLVDRDYREVHRNLQELESLGAVEFDDDGRRKRPVLRAGATDLDISIRFGSSDSGTASPAET